MLSTVNIFHHFINPEILEVKLAVQIGWVSELEGGWNGDSSGDSHVLDQGYFRDAYFLM